MMAISVLKFAKRLLRSHESKIQDRITALEKTIQEIKNACNQEHAPECYLHVDKIHVDKVFVERFDLNNNFANLGIKDLCGTMNIGANYGPGFPPPEMENLKPNGCYKNGGGAGADTETKERRGKPQGPKVTISYGK